MLDRSGNLLDQAVIYPHPPQNRRSEAKIVLKDLVGKHQVGVVAIGNGTACRETEELVAEIIAEGIRVQQPGLCRRPRRSQQPAAESTPEVRCGRHASAGRRADSDRRARARRAGLRTITTSPHRPAADLAPEESHRRTRSAFREQHGP